MWVPGVGIDQVQAAGVGSMGVGGFVPNAETGGTPTPPLNLGGWD